MAHEQSVRSAQVRLGLPILVFLVFFVLFFLAAYFLSSVVVPFLIPVILAYLLSPLVTKMVKHGISRGFASMIVLVGILVGLFFLLRYGMPALFNELESINAQLPHLRDGLQTLEQKLSSIFPNIQWGSLQNEFASVAERILKNLVGSLPDILRSAITFIYFLVIIPFLFFFFLKDGRLIIKKIICLVPNRYFEVAAFMTEEINNVLGRFLRGIFIENSIIAALAVCGLSIIGMKNAVLIGIVIGVFNVIPYMGPTIGFIIASVVFFATPVVNIGEGLIFSSIHGGNYFLQGILFPDTNPSLVAILSVIAIVQLTDNVLVYPLAIGKSVNLHPIIVIGSLLLGGFFLGMIGMLLAVPILTCLVIIFKTYMRAVQDFRV